MIRITAQLEHEQVTDISHGLTRVYDYLSCGHKVRRKKDISKPQQIRFCEKCWGKQR